MFTAKFVRENIEIMKAALENRGEGLDLGRFSDLDGERRELLSRSEELKREKNLASAEIAELKESGEEAEEKIAGMREIGKTIKQLNQKVKEVERGLAEVLSRIPNIPHVSVPPGKDESANVVVREGGKKRDFDFEPLPHHELGEALGILDFRQGAKVSGAHFPCYRGIGAQLERALINFMLDLHVREHGHVEVFPPFLANREAMFSTGQLPKLEEDMYICEVDDYFLNPTGEVPLINLHRGDVLKEADLPMRYVACTACFRREAGSYGRATKGLLRVHQFNKVELVSLTTPEGSYDELERLVSHAEEVLKRLDLCYRVSLLCTGELPFASAKTYDVEVWAPGVEAWLEVSSVSNAEDFQARRGNLRFKRGRASVHLHTLNASGVATPRTFAAILESCQQEDGSVTIPQVLRPYMDGRETIG